MQIAATLWIYPFPRSGSTLIDSVCNFVILNQALLVINFVLQFGAFYVDWLAYRVYEHPPIALGVTCLISLITGIYLFAAGLAVKFGEPLITFTLLIGFSRLAMNILSRVFFAILSKNAVGSPGDWATQRRDCYRSCASQIAAHTNSNCTSNQTDGRLGYIPFPTEHPRYNKQYVDWINCGK